MAARVQSWHGGWVAEAGRIRCDPADYTNIIELRVHGTRVYAFRAITLIGTEYRLARFDVAARQRLTDRKVLEEDIVGRR